MDRRPLSILDAGREQPGAVAIVADDGEITYGDLAARCRRVIAWLGARPLERVAVVATLRVETVIAFLALFELGIPVVAIHPRATAVERAALLRSVPASLVLDETWSDAALPDLDVPASRDRGLPPPTHTDDETALAILFTSGTSGSPKGVVLSRRAFISAAAASADNLGWQEDDRWLLCMPLGHVGGLSVIVRCLIARKTIVLVPWGGSVDALCASIERHRVSLLSLVPTMLRRIFDEQPAYRFPPCVRAVLLGGDAAPPPLLDEAAARGAPVLATYGMTEACAQVATQRPGERPSAAAGVGAPLRGVEIRVSGGEVQVRGPMLMTGYYPVGASPSPFLEGGWFATGDIGELDAGGRLSLRGRKSDRLITGGENVDPLEVERVLVGCPGVREACVFGIPDERWGETIAAAIVPQDLGSPPLIDEIARAVAEQLAAFKRPRGYVICAELVLNGASKVDRARTRDSVRDRVVALSDRRG